MNPRLFILLTVFVAAAQLGLDAQILPVAGAEAEAMRQQMFRERGNNELQAKVQPFKVFDNLYFVGDGGVSSWLITTKEGLVLLDTNSEPVAQRVIERVRQLGFDPRNIKFMVCGEGHADHCGGAAYVEEMSGAKVVALADDWELAFGQGARVKLRQPANHMFVKGGDTLTVGETTFTFYQLPGHTPGGLSIEFTVHDGGRPYKAFSFAGSGNAPGVPMDLLEKEVASTRRVEEMSGGIQVNVQNHPWLMGNVLEKGERLAKRKPNEPHPFVDPEAFGAWTRQVRITAEKQLEDAKKAATEKANSSAGSR